MGVNVKQSTRQIGFAALMVVGGYMVAVGAVITLISHNLLKGWNSPQPVILSIYERVVTFLASFLIVAVYMQIDSRREKWVSQVRTGWRYVKAHRYRKRRLTKTHQTLDTLTRDAHLPMELIQIVVGYDPDCCVVDCVKSES